MSAKERSPVLLVVGGVAIGVLSCALSGFVASLLFSLRSSDDAAMEDIPDRYVELALEEEKAAPSPSASSDAGEGARARREEGRTGKKDARKSTPGSAGMGDLGSSGRGMGGGGMASGLLDKESAPEAAVQEAPAATTRSWFPETFLWAPRVRTDAQGEAVVPVTVPDQLSTWRVLGLSAADDGSVSGGTLTFDSTMDVFVEPASVPFLRQDDRLRLPVRVGNLTEDTVRGGLIVRSEGLGGGLRQAMVVPSGGSSLATASLVATRPGTAMLEASLDGRDTVIREVDVLPRGQRVVEERRGLLGGTQELSFDLPPGTTYARVVTTVVPGPAGVLRAELAAGIRGRDPRVESLAQSVAIGAMGPVLLERLGQPGNDEEARRFRALRLRAQPGLVRAANREASPVPLSLAILALESVGDDPLAQPLATRLRRLLLDLQGLDGSWSVPYGVSLNRLVATTAWVSLVLDDPTARVRASAVFERFLPVLLQQPDADPYTLSLVLAAGELTSDQRAAVTERIVAGRAAIAANDGSLEGLERLDGRPLGKADLAVALGLAGLEPAASLQAAQEWTRAAGVGDPLTTLGWLRVLSQAEPVAAEPFDLSLALGGETSTLTIQPGQSAPGVVLPVPAGASRATLSLQTAAAQTAIGWQVQLEAWVPWTDPGNPIGLLAELDHDALVVGKVAQLRLAVEAPDVAGVEAIVRLPAGVQVLEETLEGATLVTSGDGELHLELPPDRDARHEVSVSVVPVLGGQLWSGATEVSVPLMGATAIVPPTRWVIGG